MRAAEWAAREAVRRNVPMRIVSAPAPPPRMPSPYVPGATVANALRAMAARSLGLAIERAEEVAQGLTIETGLLSGLPSAAVTGCGHDASMLVLGARGSGGFGAMMLGSVSRHCAAHAPCPVVIVREETNAVQREVTVGIRDPEDAQGALAFAFEEAALRGAELLVVHSWAWIPPSLGAGPGSLPGPEVMAAAVRGQLEDMLAAWREKYPTVKAVTDVMHAHPGRALASLSARSDLVVIGRHTGLSLGSIRNVVLGHAHGPVAIVPSMQQ
jgi:nucleotide-binding universal stress UspA family protein